MRHSPGGMRDMSSHDVKLAIMYMIVLLLSICVHEFGHAFIADKLGDDLPRKQGRLTLNPMAHADPIGTLVFPLIGILWSGQPGFGWGKPVQTIPNRYTRRFDMRTGHMFVALAGPAMNILFGTLLAVIHCTLLKTGVLPMDSRHMGNEAMGYAVGLNFMLFFFNLLPFPPLDGGAVVEGLLPRKHLPAWQEVAKYGPFMLLAVIAIPRMAKIFWIPANHVTEAVYSLLRGLFGL